MQMQSVETKAGMAISCAPSRMASFSALPEAMCRWMFSMATVASSTRMPTASASPPRVIRLMVSPSALRMAIEVSTESGMESAMMSVLRQEPRNSRIISAVSAAAMTPSRTTPVMAARTKIDWSANSFTSRSAVRPLQDARHGLLDPADHVERGGGAGLIDGEQRAAHAVVAHDVLLRLVAVAHLGHVAHADDARR